MPKLLPTQYAKILYKLTKNAKDNDLEKCIEVFVKLLHKDQMIKKLPYILNAFNEYANEKDGMVKLSVLSARPLNKKISEALVKSFGEGTQIDEKIDTSLKGGIIIRKRNTILDGSLKSQLVRFKRSLT